MLRNTQLDNPGRRGYTAGRSQGGSREKVLRLGFAVGRVGTPSAEMAAPLLPKRSILIPNEFQTGSDFMAYSSNQLLVYSMDVFDGLEL